MNILLVTCMVTGGVSEYFVDCSHDGQVESLRAQLSEAHNRAMEKLRREMAALQEEEKEREEQELEAARKRQIAIDDLDRGVGALLKMSDDSLSTFGCSICVDK